MEKFPLQLTDSKGTPVGVASVQYIPGSGHPVMLSYHSRGTPQPNISQPIASIQPDTTATNTQRRVTHILPLQQGPLSAHTQQTVVTNIPSLAQPGIVQATQVVQKQNDNTFRFAQMGSGGQVFVWFVENSRYFQFTVAPSTDKVPNKSAPVVMKTTDHVGAPQTSLASSNPSIANIVEINPPSSQLATTGVPTTPLIVSFQPTATGYHTSPQNNSNPYTWFQNSYQTAVAQNGFACEGMNPCVQDSPRTADLAGDSPHMPNSGQSETIAETGDGTIENPITFDDPSSILTPAALSMHEEMLRAQQKKIEMLLEELAKSQAHLKREQQLILTAKKAQQRIRERQRENATNREREQWLRELDVGHINKQHIQHFLQHKKQQATLQRHSMEHNRLTTTEARLQEELHVEQAVQDIVRLIKQAEQQQASSPDTDKLSQVNSPASATRDSQARNTCEIESRNCEGQTNVIENDQQSIVIYDASGIQLNHDRIFVCQQNTSVVQEEEKSQSVDMEEIFKSVLEDASRAINNDVTAAQVQLSEMEMEGSLIENTNQPQQVVSHAMMNAEANIVQQPTVMNSAQNYDQQTHHVGYSQDIEDLMAVLRDDQDGGMKPGSFQMDLGVGYGSEELADLLGEDWLDCADRSIANNGQYAPYESESHDGVGGRSTDPMCMQSHSEVGVGDQHIPNRIPPIYLMYSSFRIVDVLHILTDSVSYSLVIIGIVLDQHIRDLLGIPFTLHTTLNPTLSECLIPYLL
uniref:WD_REPEATS_REGION domain-containing protein n=1 Tax=Angiostrongylus cantonensis TaxID=6313 RepID=A0A0K0DNQ8_ANGCA